MPSSNSTQILKLNLEAKLKFSNSLLLLSITICIFLGVSHPDPQTRFGLLPIKIEVAEWLRPSQPREGCYPLGWLECIF